MLFIARPPNRILSINPIPERLSWPWLAQANGTAPTGGLMRSDGRRATVRAGCSSDRQLMLVLPCFIASISI
jgi:hypothetical protein